MSQNVFSSHHENADFLNSVMYLVKKGYFIRKWANLANIKINPTQKQIPQIQIPITEMQTKMMFDRVIQQDSQETQKGGQSNIEQIQILQKQNKNYLKNQNEQQKPLNLRYGDIVFFKNLVEIEENFVKGIILGDGIASNKMECVPENELSLSDLADQKPVISKNAKLLFRKSQFQIKSQRKYYYSKLLEQYTQMKIDDPVILDQLKIKCTQEEDENERIWDGLKNQNVLYGQTIQLHHIYSQTVVCLKTNVLAYQTTCRELSLEEKTNEYSNFVFQSSNNAKKPGEQIHYSDRVKLNCAKRKSEHYFVNIDKDKSGYENFNQGLEVNASYDKAALLKLCSFMDYTTSFQRKNSSSNQDKILQGGDIIVLFNRSMRGKLAVRRKKERNYEKRIIYFEINNELEEMKQHFIPYFSNKNTQKNLEQQNTLEEKFQIYLKYGEDTSIQTFWEIQKEHAFCSMTPSFSCCFRLKNVATGLYLLKKNGLLSLTFDGLQEDCLLYLQPAKVKTDDIKYNQQVKIQAININSNEILMMYCADKSEKELILKCQKMSKAEEKSKDTDYNLLQKMDDVYFVQKSKLDKKMRQRILFEIKYAFDDIQQFADRISSLQTYLYNFSVFLQDWGIEKDENQKFHYSFEMAFATQNDLSNQVSQFNESLDNLDNFLQNDLKVDLKFKQSTLLQNGIITQLIQILRLLHFQIYGNPTKKSIDPSDGKAIPFRSAQHIAFQKLRKTLSRAYTILYKCIRQNSESCSHLFKEENDYYYFFYFFLKQLKFYPEEVKKLFKEAMIFMNEDHDKKEKILKKWVQLLLPVTKENVEDQSFFVELLGNSVVDSLDQPDPQIQNILGKKLFESKSTVAQTCLARFIFDQRPLVSFSCKKKFEEDNPNLCELYRKATAEKNYKFRIPPEANTFDIGFIDSSLECQLSEIDTGILQKYEDYLINILILYSGLCKGRNKKRIEEIKKLGIDGNFIKFCIQYFNPLAQNPEDPSNPKKEQIHLRYYKCFVDLYDIFFIDVEPFIRISDYSNECPLQEELQQFKIQEKSFNLFKDLNLSEDKKKELKDKLQINTQNKVIKEYAQNIVKIEEGETYVNNLNNLQSLSKQIFDDFLKMNKTPMRYQLPTILEGNQALTSDQLQEKKDLLLIISKQSLEAFISNLNIILNKIDFGHNDQTTNALILKKIPNIFLAYIDQQSQVPTPEELQYSLKNISPIKQDSIKNLKFESEKNWIYDYFRKAMEFCGHESHIVTKVMIQAIKILTTLQKLQIELKIVERIQQDMLQLSDKPDKQYKSDLDEEPNELLDKNFFGYQQSFSYNTIVFATLQKCGNNQVLKQALLQNLEYNLNKAQTYIKGIKMVEVIEDQYELSLYWKINGESDLITKTPKEIQILVQQSIIYFKLQQDYQDDHQISCNVRDKSYIKQLNKKFLLLKDSLKITLKILKLSDYENLQPKPQKSKREYITQLQNIVRNFKLHEYFMSIFQQVDITLFKTPEFKDFYDLLIEFFEFFQLDNMDNKAILLPYIPQFLDLAFMPYKDWNLEKKTIDQILEQQPIQIHKIINQILVITKNKLEIKKTIDIIFKKINENSPITESYIQSRVKQKQYLNIGVDVQKSLALLQLIKILRYLTRDEDEHSSIIDNQKYILYLFLREKLMQLLVQPIEVSKLKKPASVFTNTIHDFLKLKMHIKTIQLMTDCCKNYLQGTQQIQRIILYDSLKSCLIELNSPLSLKRAYIRAIFEIYINKKKDKENEENYNETIGLLEISEIISKEIIPLLDMKNIYQYIEGLVKYDGNLEDVWKTRKSLIQQKADHFGTKYLQFKNICLQDIERLKRSDFDKIRMKSYIGVVKDPQEFWKYLMKEGVLHFISDCYDDKKEEIEKNLSEGTGTTLADDFSIVKTNLLKIRNLYETIETEFHVRTDLLDMNLYSNLIKNLEELIPSRKIIKSGQTFRIQSISQVEIFDSIQEDNQKDGVQLDDQPIYTLQQNLGRFMMRNRINIDQFTYLIFNQGTKGDTNLKEGISKVLNRDRCLKIAQDLEIQDFLRKECQIAEIDEQTNEFVQQNAEKIKETLQKKYFPKRFLSPENYHQFLKQQDKTSSQQIRSEYEKKLQDILKTKYNKCRVQLSQSVQQKKEEDMEMEEFIEQRIMRDLEMITILISFFQKSVEATSISNVNMTQQLSKKFLQNFTRKYILNQQLAKSSSIKTEQKAIYQINSNYLNLDDEQFKDFKTQYLAIAVKFIQSAQEIFVDNDLNLLKMIRLILQAKQYQQCDLNGLKDFDLNIQERSKRIIQIFEIFQQSCRETKIHVAALKCLNTQNLFELQYESLNVLILILYPGNYNSQQSIYSLLSDDQQLSTEFFNYLRKFFQQDIQSEIKYIDQQKKGKKDFISQFESKTKLILLLLQQLCENVNMKFQSFLRDQSLNQEATMTASTNVIQECSNFLSYLLEDDILDIKIKDQMIISCINSLNEFCTGQEENQKIICNNKRLFTFINSKIIINKERSFKGLNMEEKLIIKNNRYLMLERQLKILQKQIEDNNKDDNIKEGVSGCCRRRKMTLKEIDQNNSLQNELEQLKKEPHIEKQWIANIRKKQEDIKQDLDMFSASIQFILVMITGNKDQKSVQYIVEQIDLLNLTQQLKRMYDERIMLNQENIQFECHCEHELTGVCNSFYCSKGHVTNQEKTILQIAFNIFIFFNYLCDMKDLKDEVIDLYKHEKFQETVDQEQSSLQNTQQPCTKDEADNGGKDIYKKKISANQVLPDTQNIAQRTTSQYKYQQNNSVIDEAQFSQEQVQPKNFLNLIRGFLNQPSDKETDLQKKVVVGKLQQSKQGPLPSKEERKFLVWFQKFIGIQEIIHSETKVLQKIYFKKPFISFFLTESIKRRIKEHLLYQTEARDSDQERILFLLQNYPDYYQWMKYKQYIMQYWFSFFIKNWIYFKKLSYILVLVISILQIMFYDKMKENPIDTIQELASIRTDSGYAFLGQIQKVVTIIQLILSIIILVSCAIEKYPVSITAGLGNPKANKNQQLKESAGFQPSFITRYYFKIFDELIQNFSKEQVQKSYLKQLFIMVIDPDNLYNALYIGITIYAFIQPFAYSVLLFDIARSSEDLNQVLMAIWVNVKKLLIFLFFGFSIMFIYGVIGWNYFRDDYEYEGWNFLHTVAYTIKEGLRSGGGISDALKPPGAGSPLFWFRWAYDLSFFVIINMLFIQIIFGIIIDTFKELREKRDELEKMVTQTCFICGINRMDIDQKSSEKEMGWYHHVYLEHNVYHMLFYIIYVNNLHDNECDSLEHYVKKDIEKQSIAFIPIKKSLSMGILEETQSLNLN